MLILCEVEWKSGEKKIKKYVWTCRFIFTKKKFDFRSDLCQLESPHLLWTSTICQKSLWTEIDAFERVNEIIHAIVQFGMVIRSNLAEQEHFGHFVVQQHVEMLI